MTDYELMVEAKLLMQRNKFELFFAMCDMLNHESNKNDVINQLIYHFTNNIPFTKEFEDEIYRKYTINHTLFSMPDKDYYGTTLDEYKNDPIFNFLIYNKISSSSVNQFLIDSYVRLVKNTADYSLDKPSIKNIRYVSMTNTVLSNVPYFLKKYKFLDELDLSSNNFTQILENNFPLEVKFLNLSHCDHLINVAPNTMPITQNISFMNCSKLKNVYVNLKGNTNQKIILVGTAIEYLKDLIIDTNGEKIDRIEIQLPSNIKSFENDTALNIEHILYVFNQRMSSPANTFYGVNGSIIIDTSLTELSDVFPNIPNTQKVYQEYIRINHKYNILKEKGLGLIYKIHKPKTLEEFEHLINNVYKKYDANMSLLGNLITRLLA